MRGAILLCDLCLACYKYILLFADACKTGVVRHLLVVTVYPCTWRYHLMSSEQELFSHLLTPHNRREFIKRAGALGLSGAALTAFLEACGSSTGAGGTTPTASVNLAGPIDMQTLMTKA